MSKVIKFFLSVFNIFMDTLRYNRRNKALSNTLIRFFSAVQALFHRLSLCLHGNYFFPTLFSGG